MPYDPQRHRRRSLRLEGYDYASPGAYLVTICAAGRVCLFGEVENGEMVLNEYGRIVHGQIRRVPRRFPGWYVDAFVVMPNHVHAIFVSTRGTLNPHCDGGAVDAGRGAASVGRAPPASDAGACDDSNAASDLTDASPLRIRHLKRNDHPNHDPSKRDHRPRGTSPRSLGAVVQNVKSTAARKINRRRRTPGGAVWQRNYYERILHSRREVEIARRYIAGNPLRWRQDRFYGVRHR